MARSLFDSTQRIPDFGGMSPDMTRTGAEAYTAPNQSYVPPIPLGQQPTAQQPSNYFGGADPYPGGTFNNLPSGAMTERGLDIPMLQRLGYSPEQIQSLSGQQNDYEAAVAARNQRLANYEPDRRVSSVTVPGGAASSSTGSGSGANRPQFDFSGTQGLLGNQAPNFNSPIQAQSGNPQAYIPGYQPPAQQNQNPPPLEMSQSGPQSALGDYFNTAGYQLLYGESDPSASPQERFQASPGYQFGVDQAMQQLQRSGASKGLLESGTMMKALSDRAQQMGLQEYNNWQNRQSQMFNNYQNRLQGLSGGPTGADYAFNTGQSIGKGETLTGNTLASLFGNQGNAGYSGILNSGAAQSGNVGQAGSQQAQVNSMNQAMLLGAAAQGYF